MPSPIHIKKLSHVALNVRDIEAQTSFYRDFVGLEETTRDEAGRVYLRCNSDHHQVVLIPAEESGMDHYALEVNGDTDLDMAMANLTETGIPYQSDASSELGQRSSLRFQDPLGFTVELVTGLEQVSPHYGARAVQPRKFQHITFRTPDPQVGAEFYTKILGLRISDWVGEDFVWLRCNPDHHGVAISRYPQQKMHHIAFEVKDMAELVHQAEYLAKHNHILLYGPGRHGPGNNLFIYFHDQEKNIVEFAADIQQIWDDEAHTPKVWDPNERWSNQWGTPASPEFRA
ncbi:MAG: VOC family protein [Chloroflexota bacterium]